MNFIKMDTFNSSKNTGYWIKSCENTDTILDTLFLQSKRQANQSCQPSQSFTNINKALLSDICVKLRKKVHWVVIGLSFFFTDLLHNVKQVKKKLATKDIISN